MAGFDPATHLVDLDGESGFDVTSESIVFDNQTVEAVGDVNGDGIDDAVMTFQQMDLVTYDFYPSAAVIYGRDGGFEPELLLEDLDGTNGFRIQTSDAWAWGFISARSAGDVNGDGLGDMILGVGAETSQPTYVLYGRAEGFPAVVDLQQLDADEGFAIHGSPGLLYSFGSDVVGGDVNQDGYSDLVISAPYQDVGDSLRHGAVYVLYGSAEGFPATVALPQNGPGLPALDPEMGYIIVGTAGSEAGRSIDIAGDINADGVLDLVIGVDISSREPYRSDVFVVFGEAGRERGTIDLTELNPADGMVIVGRESIGDESPHWDGHQVRAAGDVNADGIDDLVIASWQGVLPGSWAWGAAHVIFGSADGLPAQLPLEALDGTNGFAMYGDLPNTRWVESVTGLGDINGDGIDDIAVASNISGPGDVGLIYVMYGRDEAFPAAIPFGSLHDEAGFTLLGDPANVQRPNHWNAQYVAFLGDLNHDGAPDFAVDNFNAATPMHVVFSPFGGDAPPPDPTTWRNPLNPLDVDDDLQVTALDALLVINALNRYGSGTLPPRTDTTIGSPFPDVNGDGRVEPIDALQVINRLNRRDPEILLRLAVDTGSGRYDQVTSNGTIAGRIIRQPAGAVVYVGLDGQAAAERQAFKEIVDDGGFVLTEAFLGALAGGELALGDHTVDVELRSLDGESLALQSLSWTLAVDEVLAQLA